MSAKRIKQLLEEYNNAWDECEQASLMAFHDKSISEEEKEALLDESDDAEITMSAIAKEIKHLQPSRYMLKKYIELVDITESV